MVVDGGTVVCEVTDVRGSGAMPRRRWASLRHAMPCRAMPCQHVQRRRAPSCLLAISWPSLSVPAMPAGVVIWRAHRSAATAGRPAASSRAGSRRRSSPQTTPRSHTITAASSMAQGTRELSRLVSWGSAQRLASAWPTQRAAKTVGSVLPSIVLHAKGGPRCWCQGHVGQCRPHEELKCRGPPLQTAGQRSP